MNRKPIMWATALAVVAAVALSVWAAPGLAERVPVHFDVHGRPDRLGSRAEALAGLPLLILALGALFWVLARLEPRQGNLARSAKAYHAVVIAILAFLVGVHGLVLLNGLGRPVPVVRAISIGIGLLFVVIGNYLGKTRSNRAFGVRTRWTLASERSWARTSRLTGRGFAALGVVVALAAVLAPTVVVLVVLVGGLALLVTVATCYSYREWWLDPARET